MIKTGIVKEVFKHQNSDHPAVLLIEMPDGKQILKSASEVKMMDNNGRQESQK